MPPLLAVGMDGTLCERKPPQCWQVEYSLEHAAELRWEGSTIHLYVNVAISLPRSSLAETLLAAKESIADEPARGEIAPSAASSGKTPNTWPGRFTGAGANRTVDLNFRVVTVAPGFTTPKEIVLSKLALVLPVLDLLRCLMPARGAGIDTGLAGRATCVPETNPLRIHFCKGCCRIFVNLAEHWRKSKTCRHRGKQWSPNDACELRPPPSPKSISDQTGPSSTTSASEVNSGCAPGGEETVRQRRRRILNKTSGGLREPCAVPTNHKSDGNYGTPVPQVCQLLIDGGNGEKLELCLPLFEEGIHETNPTKCDIRKKRYEVGSEMHLEECIRCDPRSKLTRRHTIRLELLGFPSGTPHVLLGRRPDVGIDIASFSTLRLRVSEGLSERNPASYLW